MGNLLNVSVVAATDADFPLTEGEGFFPKVVREQEIWGMSQWKEQHSKQVCLSRGLGREALLPKHRKFAGTRRLAGLPHTQGVPSEQSQLQDKHENNPLPSRL